MTSTPQHCPGMELEVGLPVEIGNRVAIHLCPGEKIQCNECKGFFRRWIVEADRLRHRD